MCCNFVVGSSVKSKHFFLEKYIHWGRRSKNSVFDLCFEKESNFKQRHILSTFCMSGPDLNNDKSDVV